MTYCQKKQLLQQGLFFLWKNKNTPILYRFFLVNGVFVIVILNGTQWSEESKNFEKDSLSLYFVCFSFPRSFPLLGFS